MAESGRLLLKAGLDHALVQDMGTRPFDEFLDGGYVVETQLFDVEGPDVESIIMGVISGPFGPGVG